MLHYTFNDVISSVIREGFYAVLHHISISVLLRKVLCCSTLYIVFSGVIKNVIREGFYVVLLAMLYKI